jgi:cytochrome b6-f complex iron-sulfur subunit
MSPADILAAARAGKGTAAAKPAPKPAAAKAKPASKPAAKAAAAREAAAPRETSSVLAAARKAVKPGPMSKAEAAARGKEGPTGGKRQAPPMPEKPSYAKPNPYAESEVADEGRRGFLVGVGTLMSAILGSFLAVGFTSLAVVGGIWTLGFARFMFPNVLIEPPNRFKVGFPSDFAPGTVTTKFKAQYGIWIVNAEYEGQPMITALRSVCTHLGCTPNWLEGEQKFKCPCHGSGFYKDGINFEGPAPRPLERYTIQLADDGQLEVDKSRIYQQEMGQWNDGSSFVPV